MREILFRGQLIKDQYDKKKGEWVCGYFYEECGLTYIIESTQKQHCSICYKNIPYIVDKESVGQFTGLKDKNGTEIYEGDMLQHPNHKTTIVTWDETECGWNIVGYGIHLCEVIGNIHDNPELSKGGDK